MTASTHPESSNEYNMLTFQLILAVEGAKIAACLYLFVSSKETSIAQHFRPCTSLMTLETLRNLMLDIQ
jgi:hypothetical protein